jgi:hypothetical protein
MAPGIEQARGGTERPVVLASFENDAADRCVDLFRRGDGSFGFEEFRRDPEDGGAWTRTGRCGSALYATRDEALAAARCAIAWLAARS